MFDKSTITLFMALLSCIDGYALTHYPPSNTANTDLDKVINGTGAPGIYWSSNTPDEEYGTYNWCHVSF
ncbi:uncharacterized protein I303_101364 [Kwoniella dejecticola CBS 10117]|uniref:Uncharacterized protein n=1 Tax=Kwoniella dejecticola CBS 10117 TaxID=1296121 RepID=A0AAJ8KJY6_9TREE